MRDGGPLILEMSNLTSMLCKDGILQGPIQPPTAEKQENEARASNWRA